MLADALLSIGYAEVVQHTLCVAGMSGASLGVFALFLKSPSIGN